MQNNLIDTALESFAASREDVFLTLKDKSSVHGKVDRFDGYVVLISGEPPRLVYRHSILKVSSTPDAPPQRPAREAVREQRPARMTMGPPREATAPRRRPPAPKPERSRPAPVKKQAPDDLSRMGEEMMKWLKSQKGNE